MLVESKSFKSEKLELKIEDNQRSFFTTAGKSLYKVTINVGLWKLYGFQHCEVWRQDRKVLAESILAFVCDTLAGLTMQCKYNSYFLILIANILWDKTLCHIFWQSFAQLQACSNFCAREKVTVDVAQNKTQTEDGSLWLFSQCSVVIYMNVICQSWMTILDHPNYSFISWERSAGINVF